MMNFFITIGHSSLKIPKSLQNRINPNACLLELAEPGLLEVSKTLNTKIILFDLHRAIIDINRSRDNLDPKTKNPYPPKRGVFPIEDFRWNKIFKEGEELSKAEKEDLLKKYYDKFFEQIDSEIKSNKYDFFVDIHLMNDRISSYNIKNKRPDITIGNLGDEKGEICLNRPSTTIDPKTARYIKDLFEQVGLSCKLNRPFAGGYIMMKYLGKFPCFQLEINKRLLMNSDNSMPDEKKLKELQNKLQSVFLGV